MAGADAAGSDPGQERIKADFEELAAELGRKIQAAGLRGLVLRHENGSRIVGVADRRPPAATLEAPLADLHAALSGRCTPEALHAMRWIGNPDPYLALLSD